MAEEEENDSYNQLYDQDNADGEGQFDATTGRGMPNNPVGQGSTAMQQDMTPYHEGQEGAAGPHGHGGVTSQTGAFTHHGKPKYQKITNEKYAHILLHSPRLTIILNILET